MNPQIRRLALDLGPLLIFFASFRYLGIFGATACFMVAIAAALGLGWFLERRLSPMPLFSAVLLGGLFFNRLFIKYVFAQAFELSEPGWKKLTVRWALFFLMLAALNET